MRYFKVLLLSTIGYFTFNSCTSDNETEGGDEAPKKIMVQSDFENEIEFKMAKIDNLEEVILVNSLVYSNEANNSIEGEAMLDNNKNMVKVTEKFKDGKTNRVKTTMFYLEAGIIIASKERYEAEQKDKVFFNERISFYDTKGNVRLSKLRTAEFEEYLDNELYSKTDNAPCKMDRVLSLLHQQGEFETNFRGFIQTQTTDYISVGGKVDGGYTSALQIRFTNPLIEMMKRHPKSYFNEKVKVDFEKVQEPNGFTYQVLLNVNMDNQ